MEPAKGSSQRHNIEFKPGKNFRLDFSRGRSAAEQPVPAFFQGENFDGLVGHIGKPEFFHAEASIQFPLVIAVAAKARGGDDFHRQIRRAHDASPVENASAGRGDENDVGLNDVRLVQDNIHRRKKHFAQITGFNVSLNGYKDVPRPTLVEKFR